MTGWHIAHIIVVSLWAGLVAGEGVMELTARKSGELGVPVARFHYYLDIFLETPLMMLVVLTGMVLLLRTQPNVALWVKVAAGLGAVASNAACVVFVIRRNTIALADANPGSLVRLSDWVRRTAFTGVPLGLLALYLGGHRGGWW